jgi:hypothetical protein
VLAMAVGAVIGLGSGLSINQVRSHQDDAQKWLIAHRNACVGYLSALHDANEAIRAA